MSFLPCLTAFWGFYPYMSSHKKKFCSYFFFGRGGGGGGGEGGVWCVVAACSYIELLGMYVHSYSGDRLR